MSERATVGAPPEGVEVADIRQGVRQGGTAVRYRERRPSRLSAEAVGAAGVVVFCNGPQPVVERAPALGQSLAHYAEVAAVAEGDGDVEVPPAVERHAGPESIRRISTVSHSLDMG